MLIKFSQFSLKSLPLVGLLSLGLNFPLASLAQQPEEIIPEPSFEPQSLVDQLPSDWSFSAPDNIGHPDNTEAGGTRGESSCLSSDQSLILLTPPTNTSYTTRAYPSFTWYVPPNSASILKFTLYDENYQTIYTLESNLDPSSTIAKTGQIMSFSFPEYIGLQPLEINQQYTWEVSLICDKIYRLEDIKVESVIQRVPLSSTLENELEDANLAEQVVLYANADPYPLWTDTLNSLMLLRRLEPNNQEVEEAWQKLLRSAHLDEIISD